MYLVETIIGTFAVDDENEVKIAQIWPNDTSKIINILKKLRNGDQSVINTLITKLESLKVTKIFSNNKPLVDSLKTRIPIEYLEYYNEIKIIKENLSELAVANNFIEKESEYGVFSHQLITELTRRDVQEKLSDREVVLIPAVQLLEDLDNILNSLAGRMREWYGIHFPEMGIRVKEHEDYSKIIAKLGFRDNITSLSLMKMSVKKKDAIKISEAAESSIGAVFYEADMNILSRYAQKTLDLYNFRDFLVEYISMVTKEVAPNLAHIAGPILGAKLIEKAGSLKKLGMMSSSKIQVLGAEKAMFRAIKTNAKPPKHGLLYQHPYVKNSPRDKRGNRARSLAAKIAIAVRADVFSGNFIAEDLISKIHDFKF
jgi:nucleolar protein 56